MSPDLDGLEAFGHRDPELCQSRAMPWISHSWAGPGWPSTCGQLKVLPARFEEEVRRQVPEVGDRREYHDSNPRFTVLKVSYYE